MAASGSLFSIAKSVLEKLLPLLQQELALAWSLGSELEKLKGTVTAIQAVLLDAEEQQEHSHQVRDWLEKLTVVLYDAEDLLDDFAVEVERGRLGGNSDDCRIRCWTVVCFLYSLPNRLIYGLRMAHKVKALREQLDVICNDNAKLHLSPRFDETWKMRKHSHTISSIPDIVVGREDDVRHIKKLLLSGDNDGSGNVVSIHGIGGMGKTMLAQLIFNDKEVREEFKLRLWVCVSESFEVKSIVQKILESITGEKQDDLELNTLKDHLVGHIEGKKYLLVLDDMWNFDPQKWQVIRSVLKCGASGSKILVTTRFQNFAKMMSRSSSAPPYALSGLSPHQSWSLFRQVVFDQEEKESTISVADFNVEEIKQEIIKKSAGVPLAVRTIGTLLYFKDRRTEWLPYLRSNKLLDAGHKNSMLHNLKQSYDYLPSHLKHCFAICSLLPKDHTIIVGSLIQLWISLGLIKSSSPTIDSKQSLLDTGLEWFMDLAWRSFFQEIRPGPSIPISTCKMHDLIHDLAVSVAGSNCKLITGPMDGVNEKTYHVSLSHSSWCPSEMVGLLGSATRLRTFSVYCNPWYESGTSWDESTFKSFVSKFGSLRILEFPNCGMEMVPQDIQKLKHLRHLDLSYNDKITKLPNSITMLHNLEVLLLNECKNLLELPRNINKLVNLWCLDCQNCFALTHMPPQLGELTALQTMTLFVVGKEKHMGELNELARLSNLRGFLQIVNLKSLLRSVILSSPVPPPPSIAYEIGVKANLKQKHHLEQLVLEWTGGDYDKEKEELDEHLERSTSQDVGQWDESLIESLQPHLNLRLLSVRGYTGERSPSWISSLTNLVALQLACCKVRYGLHHLEGLPMLKRIVFRKLIMLEYIDEDEDNGQIRPLFFPSLEELYVSVCPKLKGWKRKPVTTQFPNLSTLCILQCPLLTSVPLFPTLDKKLMLVNTSLEPLLQTMLMNMSSSSSTSYGSQFPALSKLKKLHIKQIHNPPRRWLQGMQHLISLQKIEIEDCSGLEKTSDWHEITHVPNITIDGYYINEDGQSLWDENEWNNFPWILKLISKA
ncbi:unnamed protein product [Linum tenue]|uniref:Uncharacterized protein n=1 Tax=Linum tenue TaxID=586396 RepID=A0AAV0K9F9_9ROSI|nr:unnamed protein product [Linum tenue]